MGNKVQRRLKSYTGAAANSASLEATDQTLARELGGYLREERIYARTRLEGDWPWAADCGGVEERRSGEREPREASGHERVAGVR